MEIFGYRKLIAYQKAKEIVKKTYKFINKFPTDERFALCDQLRRAEEARLLSGLQKSYKL